MLAAARRQHRRQRRTAARALVAARRAWRLLDQHALDATSSRFLARLLPVGTAAQLAAAASATTYVAAALVEQGIDAQPVGRVVPEAFAGGASDGRRLSSQPGLPRNAVKTMSALSEAHTSDL